jgi:hypothetical protein
MKEIETELKACQEALQEQRLLRKNKVRETNPADCIVPQTGLVVGGWRHEAKLLKKAKQQEASMKEVAVSV